MSRSPEKFKPPTLTVSPKTYQERLQKLIESKNEGINPLSLLEDLLGNCGITDEDINIYENLFTLLYPENTCPYIHLFSDIVEMSRGDAYDFELLGDEKQFIRCLRKAERQQNNLAITMSYFFVDEPEVYHSNLLWIDTSKKEINRYEPFYDIRTGKEYDIKLGEFLKSYFPEYKYLGKTNSVEYSVQYQRSLRRGKTDAFCTDYTLLYSMLRIKGLSDKQASRILAKSSDEQLIKAIEDIYKSIYEKIISKEEK